MQSLRDDPLHSIRHDITKVKNKLLLSSNKFADCSFLVGLPGGEQKTFHAIKSEMLISSSKMRNCRQLLDDSMATPMRIDNVKPKTFKLVLEFVHLNEVVSHVRSGGDAIDLAIAAKNLGVNFLDQESAILLEPFVTVSNVWNILECLISRGLKTAALACSDTLTLLTTDSINNPAALKVSEGCIMFALELQNFNVKTEMEIVDFCVNWAAKNPDCVGALRRFLPHLRLLTLTLEEAAVLPPTLVNPEEKMALIETIVSRDAATKPVLPISLNASNASRVSSCGMKVVLIPDTSSLVPLEKPSKQCRDRFSNTVWLIPKLDVCLTAIEILMENGKTVCSYISEKASKVTLKLVDRSTKTFIPFQFPTKSEERTFVLQNTKLSQWILKKDKQVCIKVVYQNDSTYNNITFENVVSDVVNDQLQKSSLLPGFKKIYFASSSSGAPAVVKSISYAIPSSVNAVGGENPTAATQSDTSSEDEEEEDDEDDYNSSF